MPAHAAVVMTPRIDLWADLNAEDDEGRNWSMVDRAREPASLVPGVALIAGVEGSGRSFASTRSTTTARFTSCQSIMKTPRLAQC